MEFEFFKKIVVDTRKIHPIWFGLDSDNIPNQIDVLEAERKLAIKLPSDYKKFIFEYGGGYFAFSNVYSLEVGSDWNLIDVNYKYDNIRNGHLLVSENETGDFYGFKIADGICEPKIYFYDHEMNNWQDTPYADLLEYLAINGINFNLKIPS